MQSKRKMKDTESVQEYFLIMKQLCSRGNVEDDSLMQYVINGINDSVLKKSYLYGCTNLDEFKQKLKVYEKIKTDCEKIKFPKSKVEVNSEVKIKNEPPRNDIRRFNCGLASHKSTNCNNKEKTSRCFHAVPNLVINLFNA